jgi:hypothetical protein
MRNRTIGLAAALLMGTALSTPATADILVDVDIFKSKNVSVSEEIRIRKEITLEAWTPNLVFDGFAEALSIVNQAIQPFILPRPRQPPLIFRNVVTRGPEESPTINQDASISRDARITEAIGGISETTGNKGITSVNQDVGNMSNQANVGSFAFTDEDRHFVNAEASIEQRNNGNRVLWGLNGPIPRELAASAIEINALIRGAINWNLGITHVNQNAGNMNNQANVLAAAVGLPEDPNVQDGEAQVALAEADLGQFTSGNIVFERGVTRSSTMSASVEHNTGIGGVNQSTGNMANQANVAAFAAAISIQ